MTYEVQQILSLADYAVLAMMLVISLLTGVYFAVRDRKSSKATEGYLMAGRTMSAIPTGISLAVSFQSSVTILGVPNDVYLYGVTYIWALVPLLLTFVFVSFVFLPIICNLRITSAYEYLGKRYSMLLRLVATTFYILTNLFYLGINIYGPAVAVSGVTNISLMTAMLSTGLICAIYTALGGLRGVIWADVFQGLVMFAGMLAIIIRGSAMQGGFGNVWAIASAGGRTSVNYESDPRLRYTFGSIVTGGAVIWLGMFGASQVQVQRMLSVKSQKEAVKAFAVGIGLICMYTSLAVLCGLVGFGVFHECDPNRSGCLSRADEVYPFAVSNMFHGFPGLTGLFLACIFSASLSTVSSGINSTVTVIMADFIKPHTNWNERVLARVAKGATFLCGCTTLAIGILASYAGDLIKLALAGSSAFTGPSFVVFILGIWCPFVNAWGALSGLVGGFVGTLVIFFTSPGTQLPDYLTGRLDVSTESCPTNCDFSMSINTTYVEIAGPTSGVELPEPQGIDNLYALSGYYTVAFVALTTMVVTIAVSLLTGGWKQRHNVKHDVIRPPFEAKMFAWIPEKIRSYLRCGVDWVDVNDENHNLDTNGALEASPLANTDEDKI